MDSSQGPTLPTWAMTQQLDPTPTVPHALVDAVSGHLIERELGRGAMGIVYQALQIAVNRTVALKMLLGGCHADPAALQRFRIEAEAIARLQHPNIVQMYEVGEHGGNAYIALEFCAGGSLDRRLNGTPLAPLEAARLVATLAQAVQAAHVKGVVHRDLKPSNILLQIKSTPDQLDPEQETSTEKGFHSAAFEPKISDFGLAKLLDSAGRTTSGAIVGTPSYMAPEQADGNSKHVGPACDIYALGAILYECLTGRPPFKAATALDTLVQVIAQEPVPPRSLNGSVPLDLETICLKCLHKEPVRRYESAQALANDLGRLERGEPIQARPVSMTERTLKWVRRNVLVASLAAAVLVTLLAGVIVSTVFALTARQEATAARAAEEEAEKHLKLAQQHERAEAAAKLQAQQQLTRAEWLVYAGKLSLAQHALLEGNSVLALQYLDEAPWQLRGWEHHHLWTRLASRQSIRAQADDVNSVAISPDGKRFVSGSSYNAVVWDAERLHRLVTLKGHSNLVSSVAFSPDGQRIVSGGHDQTARVWNAATGQQLLALLGHSGAVHGVAFSPDGQRIVSASADQTVKLWDAGTGKELLTLNGHTGTIYSVAFSPDGKRLVSASADRTMKLWDAGTGKELLALKGHSSGVDSVMFSPDGLRVVSGSSDKTVRVWDVATGQELLTLSGHSGRVHSVAFSPDGQRIASGARDRSVKVWDAMGGTEIGSYLGHIETVSSVAFSPDGRRLFSGGRDHYVKVWEADKRQEGLTLTGHSLSVHSVALHPEGRRFASAGDDNTVSMWDLDRGTFLYFIGTSTKTNKATIIAFSPDGKRLGSGGRDATVRVCDATSGQELRAFKGHTGWVRSVAFHPDGNRLASAGQDQTVKVWDSKTGQELLCLQGHSSAVYSVAFSPDGNRLASAGQDKTVKLWDSNTGQELFTLQGHTQTVQHVAFSPDGKRLVSTGRDKTVKVWDAYTGQELLSCVGHTDYVNCAVFSPDGQRLVSGSSDKTVKVWEAATGLELLSLQGHTDAVNSLGFSKDGQCLVSGSKDKTVRVWKVEQQQPSYSLRGVHGVLKYLAFSADSKRLFAWDNQDTVYAWSIGAGRPVEPADPPGVRGNGGVVSPDGSLHATPNHHMVTVFNRELRDRQNVWLLPEQPERSRYHSAQASRARQQQQWFAVAFHLGRLLLDDPDNATLKQQRAEALKNHGQGRSK